MRPLGEDEAHSHQRHERTDDQRAEREPERIVLEIELRDAVEAKVEREVIDEHQAQRAAAQRVDAVDARSAPSAASGAWRIAGAACSARQGRRARRRLRLIATARAS